MTIDMNSPAISFIGEYQLGNLISNQIPFLFIYVSDSDEIPDHPLLNGAVVHSPLGLVDFVESKAANHEHPIVLVCDRGEVSKSSAETLVVAGYLNVFVVKEGVDGIS